MPISQKVRNRPEYVCLIHETKPEACKDFPHLEVDFITKNEEECIEWNCEGYKEWKKIYRDKFGMKRRKIHRTSIKRKTCNE